jgi:hypothetical protein
MNGCWWQAMVVESRDLYAEIYFVTTITQSSEADVRLSTSV